MSDVAVIMSVYKKDIPEYLSLSLNSMFNQTYPCDVYLIADGPLGKDLLDVIDGVSTENFFYFSRDINLGLAASLNELIDSVLKSNNKYKYIARMDSDDISFKNRISEQVSFLNKNNNIGVLGAGCVEFSSDGKKSVKKILPESNIDLKNDIIKRSPFVHPAVVFRRCVLEKNRYPENSKLTEDYAFWINLAKNNVVFANLSIPLLYYRFDNNVYDRRRGIKKGYIEFRERFIAMRELNIFSTANILYAIGFFVLRAMPKFAAVLAYKYLR